MAVDWSYYDKFEKIEDKYLPMRGEGETMATQIVTAVTKLVYKWYNDGDVFDNTHELSGWWNDLSDYAQWLVKYTDRAEMLYRISFIKTQSEYEDLLKALTDSTNDVAYLEEMDKKPKKGSIYECDGVFRWIDRDSYDEYDDDDSEDGDWYFTDDEDED